MSEVEKRQKKKKWKWKVMSRATRMDGSGSWKRRCHVAWVCWEVMGLWSWETERWELESEREEEEKQGQRMLSSRPLPE